MITNWLMYLQRKCVVVVTHSKHLAEEADEILEIKNGAISFLSE